MGNCQAIDAATLVIQHPSGREERLYWPVTANEVMKMNPGHYVALLITTTTVSQSSAGAGADAGAAAANRPNNETNNHSVRFTRIKLLRPIDTLVLGQVYRLITTQEVMKVLWAKKCSKMKKNQSESAGRVNAKLGSGNGTVSRRSELEKTNQVTKHEMHRPRTSSSPSSSSSTNSATSRSKTWQPSLQSISEGGS